MHRLLVSFDLSPHFMCRSLTKHRYMGALSNSGRRTANYVGFYKGIQSAGAAVMWSLDSRKISFMAEFASNWALLSFSLLCAAPVVLFKISDHSLLEEDLQGTDETVADVLPANVLSEKSVAHPQEA